MSDSHLARFSVLRATIVTAAREYIREHGTPDDAVVQEIVRRVIETVDPDRIILFGSAARGDMGPDSDLDFLVIKSGKYDRGRLEGDMYVAMRGVGLAADFVLLSPELVEHHKDSKSLIVHPALSEGIEVYTRATQR